MAIIFSPLPGIFYRKPAPDKPAYKSDGDRAFDNPLGAQPAAVSPKFESTRNCKIQEEADWLLINADTKQQFTYRDACVVHGPHLGHDPVATQAAKTSVNAFLQTVFKLQ
jgi:hypothetical protein